MGWKRESSICTNSARSSWITMPTSFQTFTIRAPAAIASPSSTTTWLANPGSPTLDGSKEAHSSRCSGCPSACVSIDRQRREGSSSTRTTSTTIARMFQASSSGMR